MRSEVFKKTLGMGGVLAFVLAVAYPFGCTSGGTGGGTTGGGSPVATNSVSMQNLSFVPQKILVQAGSTVTWSNNDVMEHSVTADPADPVGGGPNSDAQFPNGIPSGATYSWPVPANAASGTVWFYHCRFHGAAGNGSSLGTGMVGSITVQ